MSTRHHKSPRTRRLVLATCALGLLLGAGIAGVASAQTTHHRPAAAGRTSALLGSATRVAGPARTGRPHRPRPTPTTVAPSTPPPSTAAPTADPTTAAPPTTPPATTPPPTVPTSAPAGDPVINEVLAHINAARAANGLAAYALSADLSKASAAHNALMVAGCGLSHQCPGEAGLGDRFTAAGVRWTSAGENIGQGNASDNQASIITAANGLTDLMLAEVAPNDGHRRNLLNSGFVHIGLAVTRGSDGRVWVTQDFVN